MTDTVLTSFRSTWMAAVCSALRSGATRLGVVLSEQRIAEAAAFLADVEAASCGDEFASWTPARVVADQQLPRLIPVDEIAVQVFDALQTLRNAVRRAGYDTPERMERIGLLEGAVWELRKELKALEGDQ